MQTLIINSNSPDDTLEYGRKIAQILKTGDIVILSGELGAGKTKFVEGFLQYYNLQNEISSPTFNIVNEYTSEKAKIFHFDVYRLEDSDEFYAIGGEEYFEKGICLIEWGEIIEDVLPEKYIQIKFKKDKYEDNKRTLKIFVNNDENLFNNIKEALI